MFCYTDDKYNLQFTFSITVKISTQSLSLTLFKYLAWVRFSCILSESDKFITFIFTAQY